MRNDKDIASRIASFIPRPIQNLIIETPIESFYQMIRQYARIMTLPLHSQVYPSPVGKIELLVCNDSFLMHPDIIEGGHDPYVIQDLCSLFNSVNSSVFYDIGSHFGYMVKIAILAGLEDSNIHTFEPDRFRFYVLSKNNKHDSIHLNIKFVSDTISKKELTLDSYITAHDPPSVVKLDIEGAEYHALKGMSQTINSHNPILFVEVHPAYLPTFGHQAEDVISLLSTYQYDLQILEGGEWIPVSSNCSKYNTYPQAFTLKALPR